MLTKARVLWGILITSCLVNIAASVTKSPVVDSLNYVLPAILLMLHAGWVMGWKRGLAFIIIPGLIGAIYELVGLRYGVVFGGEYIYRQQKYMVWDLPVIVPLYWSVFIYFSYWFVNSFLIWLGHPRPSYQQKNFLLVLLLIICDGLVVTSIDIPMDPLAVANGVWKWVDGGTYFEIPIGNFFGWFLVASTSSAILRTIEYHFPQKPPPLSKSIFLLPVVGYSLLMVSFILSALLEKLPAIALIAIISMFPIILTNVLIYAIVQNKK